MARILSRINPWVELAKNVVQIFALLVAAGWAYDKYLRAEAPGLRERIKPEDIQPFYDETLSGSESLMHGIKRPPTR